MTLVPDPPTSNGLVHIQPDELTSSMAERYAAGATLDELAVEFRMPPSRCRKQLLAAGPRLRSSPPTRAVRWFDPAVIPLDRQREIADAYRVFPGYEVAAAYDLSLPWVQKIAALHGVRKVAPRGYRKRRGATAADVRRVPPVSVERFLATLVVDVELEAANWEAAVSCVRQAGTPLRVLRVCSVQRLVALEPDAHPS